MVLAFGSTEVLVALLTGSTVSALLTYLGLRRRLSGRARTTDAENLWTQESRIREHLERDNLRLRAEFNALTDRVFELRSGAIDLGSKLGRATEDVRRLTASGRELRAENRALRIEIDRLRGRGGS